MRKNVYISLFALILLVGAFYFFTMKKAAAPVVNTSVTTPVKTAPVVDNTARELCFAKFGIPNSDGDADMYSLRMYLKGDTVKGELNLLPAEKDSKTGQFEGVVSAVDKSTMARTVDAVWDTFGEGMENKEQLKIVFGEGEANIGMGEMVDNGKGTYVYKDSKNINYSLGLTDVACLQLIIRTNVINYLHDNLTTLSPVKATLGGTWLVDYQTIDLNNKSGVVVYDDGHSTEKKNFTYKVDGKGAVTSLVIAE